jgi:Protein of unknown function (DUF616)
MTWLSQRGAFRERFGRAKVAVYTAVTGNYDEVRPPAMTVRGWDYLCFTDDTATARPGWDVRALPHEHLDRVRRSRLPKILAHQFLREYDMSIWIDANVGIRDDLAAFAKMALARADIAFFRHGARRQSVAAEIQACAQFGKAPLPIMSLQYERYRAEGFPDDAGIIPEAGVIVRRHHRPAVRAAMEEWWAELLRHAARDQISLPYVLWKNSLPITMLDLNFRTAPWFTYRNHGT